MIGALPWLTLALIGVALAAAVGALTSRSLFVMCVHVVTAGVSVAAAVLLTRAGDGGLALALFAAAWAPVLLMAAMLLSVRSAKGVQRGVPWLSVLGVVAAAAATWWPLLDLVQAAPVAVENALGGLGFWLTPIMLAAGAACVGVIGYGDRGVFARGPDV